MNKLFLKEKKTSILLNVKNKLRKLSRTGRIIFGVAFTGLILGTMGIFQMILVESSFVAPTYGGVVTEGVIGTPRFINPVLAESDIDIDLTRLIFSGLMKRDQNGQIVPNMARNFSISEDGKTYVFFLRDDLRFHDNHKITAFDVVFTIDQTQAPGNQSPHKESWQGIKATVVNQNTVKFELPQVFPGFIDQTTIGVLPSHIWEDVPAEQFTLSNFNTEPVGNGPFKVKNIKRNKSGVPIMYKLKSNKGFWEGSPFLKNFVIKTYQNKNTLMKAFIKKEIDTMSAISPQAVRGLRYDNLLSLALPRIFGLYINKNRNELLKDTEFLNLLEQSIDKELIVSKVLHTFGTPLHGPLPQKLATIENKKENFSIEEINQRLDSMGWKRQNNGDSIRQKESETLQIKIATSNTPELVETANLIKQSLANTGILVTIDVFESKNLELDIIQPRNFEILLFGQVIRHDTDLYAFWHSSQTDNEGLNITNYENESVDKALTKAVQTLEPELRRNLYRTVEEQITQDMPAVFLYTPDLIYVSNKPIKNFGVKSIIHPSDRLNEVHEWYVTTERIWNFIK